MKTRYQPKQCDLCEFRSCTYMSLTIHLQKVHGVLSRFQCPNCNLKFPTQVHLSAHMKTKDTLTNCNICEFKSCTNTGMNYHKLKYHGETKTISMSIGQLDKPKLRHFTFECVKCDQKFENKTNFHVHMTTQDKPSKCDVCNFKSCTDLGMISHKKKIHGVMPKTLLSNCMKWLKNR